MNIQVVRHTRVGVNEGICYGQSDVPLAETAEIDIAAVLKKITLKPDLVVSSPLTRCTRLAERISKNVQLDPRLVEINMGDWENKPFANISSMAFDAWLADYEHISPPNGETYTAVYNRMTACFLELVKENVENLIIVGHDGVLRSMFAMVLGISMNQTFNLHLDYGSILDVSYQNKQFKIMGINRC